MAPVPIAHQVAEGEIKGGLVASFNVHLHPAQARRVIAERINALMQEPCARAPELHIAHHAVYILTWTHTPMVTPWVRKGTPLTHAPPALRHACTAGKFVHCCRISDI